MQRTLIFRLPLRQPAQRPQVRDAQIEAGRVYTRCVELHTKARGARVPWPNRDALQKATRRGFALHSQSIQMICHEFLANVETTRTQRAQGNKAAHFPKQSAKYRPLLWPAQTVRLEASRILLPMGRGRKSLQFDRPEDFPAQFGSVKLVFDGGAYALHVPVELPDVAPAAEGLKAACDLGEIHLGALVTEAGSATVVSGRGIRALKHLRHKQNGQIARKRSRCVRGSRRHRRINFAQEKMTARTDRQIRDLRHKATHQIIAAATAAGVTDLFVGDPHGVRKRRAGRRHNQRMSSWEYGVDKRYLKEKGEKVGITVSFGDERGTSSTCPGCLSRVRPKGRKFACPHCRLTAHRDVVGGTNQLRKAFELASITVPDESRITYLRPGPCAGNCKETARGIKTRVPVGRCSRPDTGQRRTAVAEIFSDAVVSADVGKPASSLRASASVDRVRLNSEAHPL